MSQYSMNQPQPDEGFYDEQQQVAQAQQSLRGTVAPSAAGFSASHLQAIKSLPLDVQQSE